MRGTIECDVCGDTKEIDLFKLLLNYPIEEFRTRGATVTIMGQYGYFEEKYDKETYILCKKCRNKYRSMIKAHEKKLTQDKINFFKKDK